MGMRYFIFTDLAKWQAVNERPFSEGSVTRQLVEIIHHPDGVQHAACIPDDVLGRLPNYLTDEEQAEVQSGLVDQLPDGW